MTDHPSALGVRFVTVEADHHGQRIDNVLMRLLKGVPKSKIYRILRTGEVRVNRGRIAPSYRVQQGDSIRIPPLRTGGEPNAIAPPPALIQRLQGAVLWEDDAVLVVDKPAGLAVHGGSGLPFGLIEVLRATRGQDGFLELAHRLDRETSGCLLLAKTPAALRALHQALRAGSLEKHYRTLLRGHWRGGTRAVAEALSKNTLRGGERMVMVSDQGKAAQTEFRCLRATATASLMEVRIATGRTHQIRVHAAHIGYPVAGDDKYGDAAFNKRLAEYGLHRLFLHAEHIALDIEGRRLAVSAPLPIELYNVLNKIGIFYDGR
ncbi:MAG: RluA family pseudouridine synthase [Gammaproteobacteria bacterium]